MVDKKVSESVYSDGLSDRAGRDPCRRIHQRAADDGCPIFSSFSLRASFVSPGSLAPSDPPAFPGAWSSNRLNSIKTFSGSHVSGWSLCVSYSKMVAGHAEPRKITHSSGKCLSERGSCGVMMRLPLVHLTQPLKSCRGLT